jgi:hypothetical protein
MEVLLHGEDQGLILWNTLNLVSPFARNLDGCFDGLGTCVHGKDHVKAKQLGRILGEAGEDIIVEGTTAECQARRLLGQGLDELGVAVALVDSAVCRKEVKIVLAFGIPDAAATRSRKDWAMSALQIQAGLQTCIPMGRGW